jgi:hypothetical protein
MEQSVYFKYQGLGYRWRLQWSHIMDGSLWTIYLIIRYIITFRMIQISLYKLQIDS